MSIPRSAGILDLPTSLSDLGYLAALLDGEGHISQLSEHPNAAIRNRVQVSIANCDVALMEWLKTIGGGVYQTPSAVRPCFRWQVSAREDVIALLSAVVPYMRIKRVAGETALAHLLAQQRRST